MTLQHGTPTVLLNHNQVLMFSLGLVIVIQHDTIYGIIILYIEVPDTAGISVFKHRLYGNLNANQVSETGI